MRFPVKPFTMITMLLFFASSAFSSELYIYPAKGQSSEQQEKDKAQDSGSDPNAAPAGIAESRELCFFVR